MCICVCICICISVCICICSCINEPAIRWEKLALVVDKYVCLDQKLCLNLHDIWSDDEIIALISIILKTKLVHIYYDTIILN